MGTFNYFNYFTEIEEYFWRKRGAHLLVSPLDWAIVETWQKAGIPLETVLRGIDSAFESYGRSRRSAGRPLKSLAYCVDAVMDAAAQQAEAAAGTGPSPERAAAQQEPFSRQEIAAYLARNAEGLARAEARLAAGEDKELAARLGQARASLAEVAVELGDGRGVKGATVAPDFEAIEWRLTVIEDKLSAAMMAGASEQMLLEIRADLDRQLAPHRRQMSSAQLAQLERQYLQKRVFEKFEVPRLSLFYLT